LLILIPASNNVAEFRGFAAELRPQYGMGAAIRQLADFAGPFFFIFLG